MIKLLHPRFAQPSTTRRISPLSTPKLKNILLLDTQKSANGFLTLKAYRLTPQAIAMYKDNDFTPEALKNLKVGFEDLFVEIPITVRNSPLTNIMLSELTEMVPEEEGNMFLDLGTA